MLRVVLTHTSYPMKIQRWLSALGVALLLGFASELVAAPTDPIPFDPAVRVGTLPNGFTYYIRHNVKPEKRVELRLAVNTGSVQEDDDQLGLAHLVEHLCFTGTKSFPKTDLIHYLQSVGSSFGPDINAYTAFDETVYMLSLPTDKEEILANGLKIMREWAHDVTFDPKEIDRERGVVVEEWRLGRGAQQRMRDKYLPVLFQGSKYAERLPIGTKESVETMSYATIERFYHDWYRPDLMCFIVVGDIDPAQIEAKVREQFGDLPKPEKPRPHESFAIGDNEEPLYAIVSDRENSHNVIELAFKTAAPHYATLADYSEQLTERLYLQAFNQRLQELTQQPNPPFLFAGAGYGHLWVRAKGAYQLYCVVPDGGLDRGFNALLTENERVRLHGFTAAEVERAKKSLLAQLELRYHNRDKLESNELVPGYVAHFLTGDPAPGAEYDFQFAQQHLGEIALADVNALAQRWTTSRNRIYLSLNVDKAGAVLPTQAQLQATVATVAASKIEPYHEKELPTSLLAKAPAPGKITARKEFAEIGVTELTLANGVRVVLKPSTFKPDEIVISAERGGGQSVFPDDYNLSAQLATGYVAESGLGQFSNIELRKMLAGKTVWVKRRVETYADAINGGSSIKDLETALQLIHLSFTAPRSDRAAYESVVTRQKALLQNVRLNPMTSFFDQAERVWYQNHPRTPNVLPTDADWQTVSFEKVDRVSRERFSNAAGFTFVFTGSFTVDSIAPLLEKYLGSLPGSGDGGSFKDLGVRPMAGPFSQDIRLGSDPKSVVVMGLEGPAKFDFQEGCVFWALHSIVERALIDKLRLELGGVYTVNTQGKMSPIPYENYKFEIVVPCAPENVTKLVAAAVAEVQRIREQGVRPDEIEKEVEAERREYQREEKDNGAWNWKLQMIYRHHEPFTRLSNPEAMVAYVTPENIQRVAQKYLDLSKAVRFTLYPVEANAAAVPAAAGGAAPPPSH